MPAQRPNHIVLVIGSLEIGGSENQLVLLAEQLARRGWVVEVFTLDANGPLMGQLEAAKIPIIDGGYRFKQRSKAARTAALIRSQLRLIFHLARERPAVVHAFLPLTNFFAAVAGRLTFVPLVVTSKRALGTHQDMRPLFRIVDRLANVFSDFVTANSMAVAFDVEKRDGYPVSRIPVIPNGIDLPPVPADLSWRTKMRQELGLAEGAIAIAKVANLIPYKGHNELLEAFAIVAGRHPQAYLVLVGQDRGIQGNLEQKADDLGIRGRVRFLGRQKNVIGILAACDIAVMASHEEGFSNAVLEKLGAGLPVVATDVGGNAEALEGMPNCKLVAPRDPEELARALLALIENPEAGPHERNIRQELVRKRYSVDAMVDSYERLYLTHGSN